MKKTFLALITLIIVGICIPAVSADEVLYDETYRDPTFTEFTCSPSTTAKTVESGALNIQFISASLSTMNEIYTITQAPSNLISNYNSLPSSQVSPVIFSSFYGGEYVGRGEYGYFKYNVGDAQWIQIYIIYDEIDFSKILTIANTKSRGIQISPDTGSSLTFPMGYGDAANGAIDGATTTLNPHIIVMGRMGGDTNPRNLHKDIKTHVTVTKNWQNRVIVSNETGHLYPYTRVTVVKNFDGESNPSTHVIEDKFNIGYKLSGVDESVLIKSEYMPIYIGIQNPLSSKWFNTTIGGSADDPTSPDNTAVTVYVKNSQTDALLANAHIDISANVNGTFYEVVNETVPSGIYSIELQPTGGGMPNPDFYRLITTVEGYNSIMPHIDFEVDGATTIYAYLDPNGGAPKDENKTFIDFYVRDLAANAISGATVNFGGYTLITNSAGYTMFEVDKSKTYSWTVSKSGYGSLTGNAVIGIAPRHTINTVLAPAVTPTTPTPIPTSTSISPNPTMTAPTGEPVSNWLEWFAAHFGRILGGGVEIGKIFMWLCFSVPVGVYVAKEAKAGAAGFMAGAGVVTLFFVLIGWVPIWLLVLLALIIGLLYAKVFNNSDNGGGR